MICRLAVLSIVGLALAGAPRPGAAEAAEHRSPAVAAALAEMHAWLGGGDQLAGWRAFLLSDRLEAELAKGRRADPATVRQILERYQTKTPGLDQAPFVKVREALRAWLDEISAPALGDLPRLCRDSKGKFAPLTEQVLVQARAELAAAAARLDGRLSSEQYRANSAAWREFLEWQVLQVERAKPRPDLTALDDVYARFAAGHEGLELACFADVRRMLRRYALAVRAAGSPALKSQYETLLDRLAGQLESYGRAPSGETALQIGLSLGWLDDARQAPELQDAVKRRFDEPNLAILWSDALLAATMGGDVDETAPVADVILNSSVRGTGRTQGKVGVELSPSEKAGELDLVFRGTTQTDETSYGGGATTQSTSATRLEARKRLRFDGRRMTALPAEVSADVQTTLRSVDPGRGGARVQQEAWRRAEAQRGQSQQVASEHARRQTAARIDRETGQQIDAMNRWLDGWWSGLENRSGAPQQFHAHTASHALLFEATQAGPGQLAAPDPPPSAGACDFVVRLHESFINNTCSQVLSGMVLDEDRCRKWFTDLLGPLDERFQRPADQEPWVVRLAQRLPITVHFSKGTFAVTVRGEQFRLEEGELSGQDVTLVYKISSDAGRFKAVRQGGPKVFPRGFTPGNQQRLSARQQALRTVLERRLNKVLNPEWIPADLDLPEPWRKAGKLRLVRWEAEGGWLVLAWNRVPGHSAGSPAASQGR